MKSNTRIELLSFLRRCNHWGKRWLVERGVEIISEASRHLTADLKARHPGARLKFYPF